MGRGAHGGVDEAGNESLQSLPINEVVTGLGDVERQVLAVSGRFMSHVAGSIR